MSVFTAVSLVLLLVLSQLVSSSAVPCPECEEMGPMEEGYGMAPAPVFVTYTQPCPHPEGCGHMAPVSATKKVITSTISVCRKPTNTVNAYTTGTSTFYISSCIPSTMWYTPTPTTFYYSQNATCNAATLTSVTTSITTSISTSTVFGIRNGTFCPSIPYTNLVSPIQATVYPTTCPNLQPSTTTNTITYTTYVASGSPPATVYVSANNFTTTALSTVFETTVQTVTETAVTIAPGQIVVTTEDITYTSQLPAGTSYATVTVGTQTVVSTLSVATQTVTSQPPAVTHTTVVPASTHVVTATAPAQVRIVTSTVRPPAQTQTKTTTMTAISDEFVTRTITVTPATPPAGTKTTTKTVTFTPASVPLRTSTTTIIATSGMVVTKTVTETPASPPTRTSTRTVTATASFYSTAHTTRTVTVTSVPAAGTRTATATKTVISDIVTTDTVTRTSTRTVTSEIFTTGTVTVNHPAQTVTQHAQTHTVTEAPRTITATTTTTQPARTIIDSEAPGYCSTLTVTQTGTISRTATATATATRVSTRTVTTRVTSTVAPPPGYCPTETTTSVIVRTSTTRGLCTPSSTPPTSNCRAATGQFNIVIQNFGAAYLTSSSGGRTPSSDTETLTFTSNSADAVVFTSTSTEQGTIVQSNGQTLYSQQDNANSGNQPIFFDASDVITPYGGYNAVQFCLQSDNTFLVQNNADQATNLMICSGILYLYTADNAADSGCSPITLVKS